MRSTSDPSRELTRIARRIVAGDSTAEAALAERSQRGLGYLLRRIVGDPALADDLVQETLRVALEALRADSVRDLDRVDAYLRGVARNLARNEMRRRRRHGLHEPLEDTAPLRDHTPDPLSRTLAAEDRRAVWRLLGDLRTERDREVLVRHYLHGDDASTVCAELGLRPSAFYVVLHRARKRFRALIERAEPAPAPRTVEDAS
ncbi:MAG: sigma-70 family RNA polymerase sigma factor [Acidobacteriota bacterium]